MFPPNLVTGKAEIDAQHAGILTELQRMRSLGTSEVPSAIAFLRQHFTTHFEAEERLMDEASYPGSALHREQHLAFFDRFVHLRARLERDGALPENVTALVQAIEAWVEGHVLKHDVAFVDYLRQQGPGSSA